MTIPKENSEESAALWESFIDNGLGVQYIEGELFVYNYNYIWHLKNFRELKINSMKTLLDFFDRALDSHLKKYYDEGPPPSIKTQVPWDNFVLNGKVERFKEPTQIDCQTAVFERMAELKRL